MKNRKIISSLILALMLSLCLCVPAFAAGDVASAVEQAWTGASEQIKTVVNNVVFPALDMILAIAFFGKLALCYFDYRKHGQFEWTGPAILFACPDCSDLHLEHHRYLSESVQAFLKVHRMFTIFSEMCIAIVRTSVYNNGEMNP